MLGVAFGEAQPPAVVVDHDADVVRVVEGCRGSIKDGIVIVPRRGVELPYELGEIATVRVQSRPGSFGSEVVLIPLTPFGSAGDGSLLRSRLLIR